MCIHSVTWSQVCRSLSEDTTIVIVSLLPQSLVCIVLSLGSLVEGAGPHVDIDTVCLCSPFSQRSKAVGGASLLSLYVSVLKLLAVQTARVAIYLKNIWVAFSLATKATP